MNVDILGIDLAKRVFKLHGADRRGRALHRAKVSRSELVEAVRQLQPHTIAMEACSSAHHWARQFQALGIEVKLINPHYVKPFAKTNKNDRNDAEAIVEAACRTSINFVQVKSVKQQDIQAIHRTRELLVQQRIALINQVWGLLAERGVTVNRSPAAFKKSVPEILEQTQGELTIRCQTLRRMALYRFRAIEAQFAQTEKWLEAAMKQSALCQKIAAIPGIGVSCNGGRYWRCQGIQKRSPLCCLDRVRCPTKLIGWKVSLARHRQTGRYLSANAVDPRARSVLIRVACCKDARSVWLQELISRRGYNRATVALADKNAQIIQSVLSEPESYRPSRVAA